MGRRSRSRSASRSRSGSRSPSRSRTSRRHHESSSSRRDDRSRDHYSSTNSRSRHALERDRSRYREAPRGRRRDSDDTTAPSTAPSSTSASASAAPKVTDENGELSMSIEETNRLRVSLGLKPLSLENKAEKNVVNLQKTGQQVADEQARSEIQKALERSKKKRELTQKLAGKSIGEQLKESSAASALDWVKQSRVAVATHEKKEQQKTKTKKKKEHDGEETYDASALAGMTVGHDLHAFDEGDEVVLTLKDTRILSADGNDVNEADDELVNVALSERDRRAARQKQAQRAMMPVYAGFDDDEFVVEMGRAGKKKKVQKSGVLAHYDEDEERKETEAANKFTLDAHGGTTVVVPETESKIGRNTGTTNDNEEDQVISLSRTKPKAMDDFYTADEMAAQFSKKGKKLRKKKKLRRKTTEENEEEEGDQPGEAADAAALMQQLEEEATLQNAVNASSDRGRRRRPAHDDEDEEDANLRRFQEAREKASAAAQSALAASSSSGAAPAKRKKRRVDMEDDVDLEMSATLARARHLAQLKQQEAASVSITTTTGVPVRNSEGQIAALVSQTMGTVDGEGDERMGDSSATTVGNVFGEAPHAADATSNTVVFNDATDFETRLRSAMEQRSSQFQAATTTTTTAPVPVGTTAPSGNFLTNEKNEDMEVISDDDHIKPAITMVPAESKEEDEEAKEGWANDQPLVGMGMGATLALLKRTGDLRESRVERQAGRANDARDRNVDDELRVKDGVKLDYRDEFGRLLTKKEAFRLLSYKFHGHKPGKKKQEKRLKQLKEELASQKLLSGEGSTKMMKVLDKKQSHAKQAYVVLSNGT